MHITATGAEIRLGSICAIAKRKPVLAEKAEKLTPSFCRSTHTRLCKPTKTPPAWLCAKKSLKLSLAIGLPLKTTG